jgi:3,4-dihydroxy 2-butanone 4-phosphate synthase / GTP cyclohydrolase II
MSLATTEEILADFKAGKMLILVDEEDRENEGDLVLAADHVTPDAINFMARFGRGLICLTLTQERCRKLRLPLMSSANGTKMGTNFTVSIEAAEGVTTGISAADRALTVKTAVAKDASFDDIVQPGHIFPIMAKDGGVLIRAGHTEAGCDLGHLTGLTPASVICEIMNDDGTMARLPDLIEFGKLHGLKIGTIADLIHYRSENESLIERVAARRVKTHHGEFDLIAFRDKPTGSPHLAMVFGTIRADHEAMVRVHEPLTVIDLIDAQSAWPSWSVDRALASIAANGCGVMIMLNCAQDADTLFGRFELLAALDRQEDVRSKRAGRGPSMDLRTYGVGAQILKSLGVGKMRLLSRPRKLPSMAGYGLEIVGFESP